MIPQFVDYNICSFKKDLPKTYENLICDPLVSLSVFETKLQDWKDVQVARIVENERLQSITDRLKLIGVKLGNYNSVSGLREFMNKFGISHSNPAIWVKELYKKGDTSLDCFESKKAEIDQEKQNSKDKDKAKKDARDIMKNYDCSTIVEPYLPVVA